MGLTCCSIHASKKREIAATPRYSCGMLQVRLLYSSCSSSFWSINLVRKFNWNTHWCICHHRQLILMTSCSCFSSMMPHGGDALLIPRVGLYNNEVQWTVTVSTVPLTLRYKESIGQCNMGFLSYFNYFISGLSVEIYFVLRACQRW